MNETIPAKNDRLVWIDLEMTGLDPHNDVIVEVAALVTDANLNILGEGVDIVVHTSDERLNNMNPVVKEMHRASGLTEDIRQATATIEDAEAAVLALIAEHCDPAHPAPLAGNSIATDRSFIREYMPALDEALHYRMVDVSSIKELTRRWFPRAYFNKPPKGMRHRALADIVESIAELDYYQRSVFTPAPGPDSEQAQAAAEETTKRFAPILERMTH
ncbi:oligoribonuclease [Corynebacterium aquilae]|uniref:Oligoribonuclease n=1 Tax=Corynebacterium aquilae DSM 44791 TaxID=1431546 RepID=A0A1L7CHE3_9CORY|nr:oligoribonuclease [Corynebacterium aquilae]APT85290.1 oligoribonuclease [Corynebacterium aquilae DSM 44791]